MPGFTNRVPGSLFGKADTALTVLSEFVERLQVDLDEDTLKVYLGREYVGEIKRALDDVVELIDNAINVGGK